MDEGVADHAGGIRGLRELINGEHAGAVNTDLRRAGLPGIDWVGTEQLSWWELREFLRDLAQHPHAALHRSVNPDHDPHTPEKRHNDLLEEVVELLSSTRFLTLTLAGVEEVPEAFLPVTYNHARAALTAASGTVAAADDGARAAAAALRDA